MCGLLWVSHWLRFQLAAFNVSHNYDREKLINIQKMDVEYDKGKKVNIAYEYRYKFNGYNIKFT